MARIRTESAIPVQQQGCLSRWRPGVRLKSTWRPGGLRRVPACPQYVVWKRVGSRYRSGRSPDWLKFKNPRRPP